MKPIQVGILVAVAAVAGGLITKWATSQTAAPVAASAGTASSAPAPAAPAAQEAPAQAAEQPLPAPLPDEKPAKEKTHKARVWHRAEPKVIAQNLPPAGTPAPEPAPQAAPAPRTQPESPEPAPAVQVPEPAAPAPPPPPAPRQVTLTSGTLIPARTVDGLSSDRNQAGDGFAATLDAPLVVDGLVIAERGAHLEGKVVQADKAGRVKGVSELAIELTQITTSDGQRVAIETESFAKRGQTSKGEDAAKIGGGAVLGAIIGAIAGGGKGAAIGTAVGGAAGAGTVAATRGKAASIAPETRISFRLKNTVTITERQGNR